MNLFFFFKQKTAYEILTRDWSSDVCSSDLGERKYTAKERKPVQVDPPVLKTIRDLSYAKDIPMYEIVKQIGRASCRERV